MGRTRTWHIKGNEKKFNSVLLNNNSPFSSAINRLPRTLAVWGESIRNQTGWNIMFLVGGPAPDQNGKNLTYMCDVPSPCSQVMLLINMPEGCIAEGHPTAKTSKRFSGKMDMMSISSRLSTISFTKHFVSRVEFER